MDDEEYLEDVYKRVTNHYGSDLDREDKLFHFRREAKKRKPPVPDNLIEHFISTHAFH